MAFDGAASDDLIELRVWRNGPVVSVAEATQRAKLPRACPERHINTDSTSCWDCLAPAVVTCGSRKFHPAGFAR